MSICLEQIYNDLTEELALIQEQIKSILGSGQEHELNDGQSVTKVKHPDLKELQRRKVAILNELAAYDGCGVEVQYIS